MSISGIQVTKQAQLTGHKAAIFSLAPGKDDRHFLSGAGDGWVVSWDLDAPDTGRLLARVETQIFSLLPLLDQGLVVVGNMNGGVHWVNLHDPGQTRNILHHEKGVYAFLRHGTDLFSAGGNGLLTRWSIEARRATESLKLGQESLRDIALSPSGSEIAVGASDNHIYLLDAQTLALKHTISDAHDNSVFCLRYHPSRPYLLSGGRDAHLKVWDLSGERQLISDQPAHWFTINDLAFHPEGRFFATASRDKSIKLWDAESFELVKVLDSRRDGGHLNSVNKIWWSPEGKHLVSCGDDRSIIIWEVETG